MVRDPVKERVETPLADCKIARLIAAMFVRFDNQCSPYLLFTDQIILEESGKNIRVCTQSLSLKLAFQSLEVVALLRNMGKFDGKVVIVTGIHLSSRWLLSSD